MAALRGGSKVSVEATSMAPVIKDIWRLDKSNWRLKTSICGTLLLCAIVMYLRELDLASCAKGCGTDSMLVVFCVVYTARLLLSMLVFQPRPPDWHEIPIVYIVFILSIFATLVAARKRTSAGLGTTQPWSSMCLDQRSARLASTSAMSSRPSLPTRAN